MENVKSLIEKHKKAVANDNQEDQFFYKIILEPILFAKLSGLFFSTSWYVAEYRDGYLLRSEEDMDLSMFAYQEKVAVSNGEVKISYQNELHDVTIEGECLDVLNFAIKYNLVLTEGLADEVKRVREIYSALSVLEQRRKQVKDYGELPI